MNYSTPLTAHRNPNPVQRFRWAARRAFSLLLMLGLAPAAVAGGTLVGRCIAVPDGDTIIVRTADRKRHDIRLQGIDAPEKSQRYGMVSTTNLTRLVYQKQVEVDWNKHDHYGRQVGRVYVGDIDVNLAQVDAGLAWVYREYLDELSPADRKLFLQAEQAARERRLGLWRDRHPTPPWEWRHQHSL
jgi:endonuclease YncB( thermonuclease family)